MTIDNPLINLPEEFKDQVVLAPHLGGITTGSFKRAHKNMGQNVERVVNGERPVNVVNGLCVE
jgi:lactate dehydrogenase-like 2-hydroxyacid dehydrogenase